MLTFNKDWLRERILACWLGKNIGGTMGTPYEGSTALNDIQGFASEPGAPLPNDDLDLQLVWLRAVDELGIKSIDSKALAEYWISYIGPCWNEYGVGKSNLRDGLVPPLSGELNNEEWKHSNGAWIRTEIWACLFPGDPESAIRYAFEDACVDHGFGEGTFAAIFVAAVEAAAFVVSDIRELLKIGLSKIPEDCRVSRSVRLVIDCYDKGVDWKETRRLVVEDSADLGWFQAPANIAFTVLGLLYGEGDFKKSMILAIDCGDDTDCTGATLGSILGIKDGMAAIPEDWKKHIGDRIITVSIITGHGVWPGTCEALTDCVMNLLPETTRTPHQRLMRGGEKACHIGDGENDFTGVSAEDFLGDAFVRRMFNRSRFSYTAENVYLQAIVEFDEAPCIQACGSLKGRVTVNLRNMEEQKRLRLRWLAPLGWEVKGALSVHANPGSPVYDRRKQTAAFEIFADETVQAENRLVLEITCAGRPTPLLAPVTVLG